MSLSLLLQQCPACFACLSWMVCEMGRKLAVQLLFCRVLLTWISSKQHAVSLFSSHQAFSPSILFKSKWCNHKVVLIQLQLEEWIIHRIVMTQKLWRCLSLYIISKSNKDFFPSVLQPFTNQFKIYAFSSIKIKKKKRKQSVAKSLR